MIVLTIKLYTIVNNKNGEEEEGSKGGAPREEGEEGHTSLGGCAWGCWEESSDAIPCIVSVSDGALMISLSLSFSDVVALYTVLASDMGYWITG